MISLLLSSSGGRSFSDADQYWQQAWNNFMYVINWMRSTTVLRLFGTDFTFWGLGIGLLAFGIVADLILKIFWGD